VITGLEPPSVKKKLKDKAFARTVNRDDVYRGAAELGVDLDAHIAFVIAALTDVRPRNRPRPHLIARRPGRTACAYARLTTG